MAISSFGFGGSNVHAIIAGCVRPQGPPPRALTAPEPIQSAEEAIESGGTVIEEVQEEPLLFPPEVNHQAAPIICRITAELLCCMRQSDWLLLQSITWLSADQRLCCIHAFTRLHTANSTAISSRNITAKNSVDSGIVMEACGTAEAMQSRA